MRLYRAIRASLKTQAVLLAVLLLPCVLFFAAGWYYSGAIEERAFKVEHEPNPFDLRATSLGSDRIALSTTDMTPADDEWNKLGTWGLRSPGSYNQVTSIVSATNDSVARELTVLTQPPAKPSPVLIDPYAYSTDPLVAHGIRFREVDITTPLGDFPAWLTSGESDTWAILVHGQGSTRQQLLRILPVLVESGHPTLTITYRNDMDLPESPSGYYQFGAEEWRDLEAAISFALTAGGRLQRCSGASVRYPVARCTDGLRQTSDGSPIWDRLQHHEPPGTGWRAAA